MVKAQFEIIVIDSTKPAATGTTEPIDDTTDSIKGLGSAVDDLKQEVTQASGALKTTPDQPQGVPPSGKPETAVPETGAPGKIPKRKPAAGTRALQGKLSRGAGSATKVLQGAQALGGGKAASSLLRLTSFAGKAAKALGALGPVGIGAAAALATVGIAAAATVLAFKALSSAVEQQKKFSTDVAIAASQSSLARRQALFERGQRIGPGLARFEETKSQFEVEAIKLWTEILALFLDMFEVLKPAIDLAVTGVKGITTGVEILQLLHVFAIEFMAAFELFNPFGNLENFAKGFEKFSKAVFEAVLKFMNDDDDDPPISLADIIFRDLDRNHVFGPTKDEIIATTRRGVRRFGL